MPSRIAVGWWRKSGEVGGVTDAWGLVRDHGDEPVTAVLGTYILDDVACDLVLGDEACAEALALLSEEAVKGLVLQRAIDLIHTVADGGELDLPRGEELPIAVVPEGDEHAVILLRCLHDGARRSGDDEVLLVSRSGLWCRSFGVERKL